MLQQGGAEEGALDAGGGRGAGELHKQGRGRAVADDAEAGGAAPVREELSAAVDELPAPQRQARPDRPRRGGSHSPPPPPPRQPVSLSLSTIQIYPFVATISDLGTTVLGFLDCFFSLSLFRVSFFSQFSKLSLSLSCKSIFFRHSIYFGN